MTYRVVIALGRLLFRLLGLQVRLDGLEHVPRHGPVVLAANHVSFVDFLLAGVAGVERGRRVRFLARHDLWRNPVAGFLLTRMGHIPVDRAAPAHAYLLAREALRRGEAVGIFPEAGVSTSYTVRAMMPGAVALARETGAPLVPVALWGGQRLLTAHTRPDLRRGRPVSVLVGEPVHLDPDDDLRRRTRDLGGLLQRMLDGLQARPEHQPAPGERAPWHPRHLGGHAPSYAEAALRESVPSSAVPPPWSPPPRRLLRSEG